MFDALASRLQETFKTLRGYGKLSESNITDAVREIRLALLEADVSLEVVKTFIAKVKERALGEEVMRSITPGQQFIKIFHDELARLLGGGESAGQGDLSGPGAILVVGLNGAGKTTTAAKLALRIRKSGRHPALIPLDLQRPAAAEQLETLGRKVGAPVFRPEPGETSAIRVVRAAKAWLREAGASVEIYDTAGRQEVNEELMRQLVEIRDYLKPLEVLLVLDAATGQQAVRVAQAFHDALGVTGLILTKLDGDARGGAALSLRAVTGSPIRYIGTGELPEALEPFHPERMAGRILGMGDVVSLVEKAAAQIELEDAARLEEKLRRAEFDFNDFLAQIRLLRKMGPLENIVGMLPGMGDIKRSAVDERMVRRQEAIVLSMTPEERRNPAILNARRRQRIARGSGTSVTQVNDLIQRVNQMKKLLKSTGKLRKLMSAAGAGAPDLRAVLRGKR